MGDSLVYLIALSMIPSIGSVTARKLISYLGSAEAVFKEKRTVLMKIPGIGEVLSQKAVSGSFIKDAENEIDFCLKNGIKIFDINHDKFPKRLKHCSDSPLLIFIKGDVNLNDEKIISIVGTRRATHEGIQNTQNLLKQISQIYPNTIIISGLAFGIDRNAHLGALKNGLKTIAVLAHGLHTLYPSQHKDMAMRIIDQGCLLTEFTSLMNPERNNFIKRNRLIAGLADATIVVESDYKGGALITADMASSYHRDVFAFPGRINDQYSKGCNCLIKENKAALIEGIDDLEFFLNWQREEDKKGKIRQRLLFIELTEEEESVVEVIKRTGDIGIDQLSIELDLPVHKLSSILLNLEFEGVISVLPGKIYRMN